ncbi:hypothetical protein FHS14_005369 [Paenibacillus baekrokdamisoli]|nr:hypothetical protein [Paenibacillus baekrokdamisoli]MBB3072337.1 hypothetical protein [Paenibacillus baekrokdamisoli]
MVHFAIVERLYKHEPSPEFILGSLAPDAIHVREQATREDKNRTHLGNADGSMPTLLTFSNFCAANLNQSDEKGWKEFVLGYITHVYTDLRWTETVWEDYTRKIKQSIASHEPIKDRYNLEVCQIDCDLYKKEEWTGKILSLLNESRAYSIADLLDDNEISLYRDRTIQWLRDDNNNPHIQPLYITVESVTAFIIRTTEELDPLIKEWEHV